MQATPSPTCAGGIPPRPTILPVLTNNPRGCTGGRAGHPVPDVLERAHQQHRHALTCDYLFGPWRLIVTGTGAMYADRRARYITRTSAPRRAAR